MAAIYRELNPVIRFHYTLGTFRKHFKASYTVRKWIQENIHYWHLNAVLKWLGRKDLVLEDLIREAEQLLEGSKKPLPVIGSAICTIQNRL